MNTAIQHSRIEPSRFADYVELCKPRVVALMMLTSFVSMLLASPTGYIPLNVLVFGSIGIAFAACAGAVINHLIDRRIDAIMARTRGRPIASGRVKPAYAIGLAFCLSVLSMVLLALFVNKLVAALSLLTLVGYAGIYTLFLKRATPQNIVIGGLAGAMPPLLGWTAVTGHFDGLILLLVLLIFTWTPPHFWALAIYRHKEYANAKIPMLPVTHGIQFTRLNILLYTFLMVAISYMPFVVDLTGLIYLAGITVLDAIFLYHVICLYCKEDMKYAMRTFHYSIFYLMMIFLLLLVDHYFPLLT